MSYVTIPEEYNFNTKFPTWIIAYCPDINIWFCTNERFFYYEHPKDFNCEEDAIEYFRNNIPEFAELQRELCPGRSGDVCLENTKEFWSSNINFTDAIRIKDLKIGE